MILWRIEYVRHLDETLAGTGARLFGGRWNRKGTAAVYLSSTLSLAALEKFVHARPAGPGAELVAVEIQVPDTLLRKAVEPAPLPAKWRSPEPAAATMEWGSAWCTAGTSLAARVPSVLLPLALFHRRAEFNLMLNVQHGDMARVHIGGTHAFRLDARLWEEATARQGLNRPANPTR